MRALVFGVATAIVVAAFPTVASATDYCVAPDYNCGGTPAPSFEKALELSAQGTNADRIFLGATQYQAQTGTGFTYNVLGSPLEIIGKGRGQTTITSPPGASSVLNLDGATASISDLTIRIPQNFAAGATGLSTQSSARRIDVVEADVQASSHRGVVLGGDAALEDSTVTLGGAQHTTAVAFGIGGGTVRRSALSAWEGVASDYGGLIERSRVTGVERGVYCIRAATTITGTLIRFSKTGAGIGAINGGGALTMVKADGVTIVGPGYAGTIGAGAISGGLVPLDDAQLILTNSIIRGVTNSLWALGAGRSGSASVRASYSDYDPSGNTALTGGTITESNIAYAGDAGFVDPVAGDYHLRSSSPLLDRGDPATLPGLDLDGNPSVVDGDGDGVARRDLGAFEQAAVPPRAPAGTAATDSTRPRITGFRADPSVFSVPRGTRLRYALSEAADVTIAIQRNLPGRRSHGRCVRPSPRLRHAKRCLRHRIVGTLKASALTGANRMRFAGRIAKRALRPGSYGAVIRATDAAGNVSGPARLRFRIVRASSRG
jgi:hypothetical protein